MNHKDDTFTIRADVDVTRIESPYVDDDFRVDKQTVESRVGPDWRAYAIPRDANVGLECYARDPEFKQAVDLIARGDVPNADDFPDEPAEVIRSNAGRRIGVEARYLGPPGWEHEDPVESNRRMSRKNVPEPTEDTDEPQGSTSEDTEERRRFVVTVAVEAVANSIATHTSNAIDRVAAAVTVDTSDPEPDPVDEAKQAYVDGELTIEEYEDELEDVLDE